MRDVKVSGDIQKMCRSAGATFGSAVNFSFEDARFGLKIPLQRLEQFRLVTNEEVEPLRELAQLAFQGADVTEAANKIKDRDSSSPVAVAIADIVSLAPADCDRALVVLGAIFGAHSAATPDELDIFMDSPDVLPPQAILGAIGGAVAMSAAKFVKDEISRETGEVVQDDVARATWMKFAERGKDRP